MIRNNKEYDKQGFRLRARDTSRLEGISDAMFAFAITLLVVSLEVPNNYLGLLSAMKGFFGFALCFLMISYVWYQHYIYFRRYALNSAMIIFLNFLLMFVVMFFIYPLKFLANILVYQFSGILPLDISKDIFFNGMDHFGLMIIYSSGYTFVFALLFLLYKYAYALKDELKLNKLECLLTKDKMLENLILALFGIISILLAILLPRKYLALSGTVYFLIGPAQFFRGFLNGKKINLLRDQLSAKKDDDNSSND